MKVALWHQGRFREFEGELSETDGAVHVRPGTAPGDVAARPPMRDRWTRRADGGLDREREETEEVTVPPVEIPMTEVDPHHPSLPPKVRTSARRALDNSWTVRLTYARGPRKKIDPIRYVQVGTFVLRCHRGKQHVTITWFQDEAGAWKPDGSYEAPWVACTMTRALEVLGEPVGQ